jgi:hypothetical protein
MPGSDGSRGQDTIRRTLEMLGPGPWLEEGRVGLDRTRVLRRFQTRKGSPDVYTAPWSSGGVCFGYARSIPAFEAAVTGCPADEPFPEQGPDFDPDEISVVRLAPSVFVIDGPSPRETARIEIRFENGSTAELDILVASSFVAWLGPERLEPGHRATGLVAFDAGGREIATLPLDPERFKNR